MGLAWVTLVAAVQEFTHRSDGRPRPVALRSSDHRPQVGQLPPRFNKASRHAKSPIFSSGPPFWLPSVPLAQPGKHAGLSTLFHFAVKPVRLPLQADDASQTGASRLPAPAPARPISRATPAGARILAFSRTVH